LQCDISRKQWGHRSRPWTERAAEAACSVSWVEAEGEDDWGVGADEGPAGVEEMESVGDGLDGVMKGGDE
jgi:hypothetical protein